MNSVCGAGWENPGRKGGKCTGGVKRGGEKRDSRGGRKQEKEGKRNYTKLQNILQQTLEKDVGANKGETITGMKGYGKGEV